jgi:hypothetical protein
MTHTVSVNFSTALPQSHQRQLVDCSEALPQKSKLSANGAEYESQGQARSEAERVAPGKQSKNFQP